MERNCNNCIHYPCLRIDCGKVCNQYKTEVQEVLEGIDKILEEGYIEFERTKIGGNMNIEAGEYVRTKDGKIIKFERFGIYRTHPYLGNSNWGTQEHKAIISKGKHYKADNIVKHSKNIIDLIEVGDYVNGSEVLDKYIPRDVWEPIELRINDKYTSFLIEEDIKTILTKELFEANCYKVEED